MSPNINLDPAKKCTHLLPVIIAWTLEGQRRISNETKQQRLPPNNIHDTKLIIDNRQMHSLIYG